ncbi:MAG: hypothetical protein D6772_01075 [Bacteroidetes bacterium]|nr:MAG: hypothetical protein D6772_01075 [Bacteroidota bacterium]
MNCNIFYIFCATLLLNLQLGAQGHIPVLPDVVDSELLNRLQAEYSPNRGLAYNETRDTMFAIVDLRGDSVYGIYSAWPVYLPPNTDPTTGIFQEGNGLNTEHAWPRAYGAGRDPAQANLHHLFPSRPDVNQTRGNLIFREVDDNRADRWYYLDRIRTSPPVSNRDAYSEYQSGVGFEPREAVKGDIARAMFYFYTIYRQRAEAEGGTPFFQQQQSTLCNWHYQDPVDAREWERTFAIAAYQRDQGNPFVLDCTLAARMYCPDFLELNCLTTSTQEGRPPALQAQVRPNPSAGRTWLHFVAPASGTAQLTLYSLQGQHLATYQQVVGAGPQEWALELPGPGYWVGQLSLDDGTSRIVQHLRLLSR